MLGRHKFTSLAEDLRNLGVLTEDKVESKLSERRKIRRKRLREMYERNEETGHGIEKVISEIDKLIKDIKCEQENEKLSKEKREGYGGGLGVGGTDVCVCPECGYEVKHDRGEPCSEILCPECEKRGKEVRMVGKGMPHQTGKGATESRTVGRFLKSETEKEPVEKEPDEKEPDEKKLTDEVIESIMEIINLLEVLEGKFEVYEDKDILTPDEVDMIDKKMQAAKDDLQGLVDRTKKGEPLTVEDFRDVLKEVVDLVQAYVEVSEDISSVEKEIDKEKEIEKEPKKEPVA